MSERRDGGPAFPVPVTPMTPLQGMTLRDWFAGQALQGLLAGEQPERFTPDWEVRAWEIAQAMVDSRPKS